MTSKNCTKCGELKLFDEFQKNNRSKNGLHSICIKCRNIARTERRLTKRGVILTIYNTQVNNSIKRGHVPPDYSRAELIKWAFSQEIFHILYNKWVDSGHVTELKPSLDRKDDYLPYTFSNIKIMTWQENNRKNHLDTINAINRKRFKPVIQFTKDGEFVNEYISIRHASNNTGVLISGISKSCRLQYKTSGGFVWRYALIP